MAQKTIYLLRHGQPELPDNQRRFIGQADLHLSAEGHRQAEALGERFRGKPIDAVFSSDLVRSVETAQAITRHHKLEPILLPGLREIGLGKWEGETFSEVARIYPREFRLRGRDIAHFRPPEGESFADCGQRALKAYREILGMPYEQIVIVGHAGVNRTILCHIMGIQLANLFRLTQDYACMNVIIQAENASHIKCLNLPL